MATKQLRKIQYFGYFWCVCSLFDISDGNVNFWHVPSMKKVFNLREDDNTILALDYSPTGEMFATGGKDCHVRIYD